MSTKKWNLIFKLLANVNRVKALEFLSKNSKMSVSEIAKEIDTSLKSTSKHLIMLERAGVLESKGKDNRVYYYYSPNISAEWKRVLKLFI